MSSISQLSVACIRTERGKFEYLVHYDGFKKTADRWMKEASLHKINESTISRFNEERGVAANINNVSNQPGSRLKEEEKEMHIDDSEESFSPQQDELR